MVSIAGMMVSLKTDLRFPNSGQLGHGSRIIQSIYHKIPRVHAKKWEVLFSHGNWLMLMMIILLCIIIPNRNFVLLKKLEEKEEE